MSARILTTVSICLLLALPVFAVLVAAGAVPFVVTL
jgi:hypothetical protein